MRAIVLKSFGGLESLAVENLPDLFIFGDIRDAHEVMESNWAKGKTVNLLWN